ncbi:MAG TPA: 4'-phosphopantetheinyl transferase superfamily protein [Nevskiaceae bacterium]|nr:4'-phosphopantetheinyl transferase superfamily protein [Nevskiaceae bacterium]
MADVQAGERAAQPRACPLLAELFCAGVATALLEGSAQREAQWPLLGDESLAVEQAGDRRRADFAAGRACARAALAQLGVAPVAIPVNDDRSPRWPDGYTGSITHTCSCAAAVAAPLRSVRALGLDAENCVDFDGTLVADVCTLRERAWLDTLAPAQRNAAATLLFSAKEAFYKCQYALTRRWLEFHEVTLEANHGSLQLRLAPADLLRLPWRGRYAQHGDCVYTGFSLPTSG